MATARHDRRPAGGASARSAGGRRAAAGAGAARPLTPAEIAWLAAVPCAAVTALVVLALGPALGAVLFPEPDTAFWLPYQSAVHPEPTEQARYLLLLGAPLLLTAAVAGAARRGPRLAPATAARLVTAAQALGIAALVACVAAQYAYEFGPLYTAAGSEPRTVYFTPATLLVAGLIAAALAAAIGREQVRARWEQLRAETPARRIAATLAAACAVALWLTTAVNFDDTIAAAHPFVSYHAQFTFDETYAVLDGRSPLVDFAAQYGSLWPYLLAAGMALLGTSVGTLTLLAATVTGAALLAVFDLLRRVTRSSLAGLALFLPLLATSLFTMRGPLQNRYGLSNLLGAFPLRYAGPLLVAWLLARHLDGARPRRMWPLFAAAGLAFLNNADFGIAALGACLAALLWTAPRPWPAALRRIGLEALAGLAAAFALVALLTLTRTGSLPHVELLFRYSRQYAIAGFQMLPLRPVAGVALVIYLTYVAAIATATVRALRGDEDRLMTGLLAWSGVFGLGAGAYYVGRSHPEVLINMFPAWGLCVTLLAIVAIRDLAARHQAGGQRAGDAAAERRTRRPPLAQLACLFGLGVLVCSLAQTPTPWGQLERLSQKAPATMLEPAWRPFVAQHAERGEPVAILMQLGHRQAHELGLDNVSPYTGSQSITEARQLEETVAALREAGGRKLFLSVLDTPADLIDALEADGFRLLEEDPQGTRLLVDERTPAAATGRD